MNLYRDKYGAYRVEATFTIYDWLQIERIMSSAGTVAGQSEMNHFEMTRLCFNILPGQNTVLHLIAEHPDGADLALLNSLFEAVENVDFPNLTD